MSSISPLEAERERIERRKSDSVKQNRALSRLIHKKNKDKLTGIQIVRFGDELVIVIDRSNDADAPRGIAGTVYTAYPVQKTGEIDYSIRLKVKVIHQQDAIPDKISDKFIIAEAKNDNILFASRTTIIATEIDGKPVYEKIILMSEVPGITLFSLINDDSFIHLTPAQRTRLAINIVDIYEILHSLNINHRDIKAENLLIYLRTLQGRPIDIDPSRNTKETAAPESTVTNESDMYSLALDILAIIFSGVRPERNESGEITNWESIKRGISDLFTFSGLDQTVPILISATVGLLRKMLSENPNDRGTLKETRVTLEALAFSIEKATPKFEKQSSETDVQLLLDEPENVKESGRTWLKRSKKQPSTMDSTQTLSKDELYEAQLCVLDRILKDSLYAIDPKYISKTPETAKDRNRFFFRNLFTQESNSSFSFSSIRQRR